MQGLGERVKQDFPILLGSNVAYLDTAASAQKPKVVIDSVKEVYERNYANIHRGVYAWSAQATAAFETTRNIVATFLNARSTAEIIFTRGATEAVNLVAYSYGRHRFGPGDELVVSLFEHHSNFVPWQLVAQVTGATLRVVMPRSDGSFDDAVLLSVLSDRTKLIAFTGLSNATGVRLPVSAIVKQAKRVGAVTVLDAAQCAVHEPVDVQALGVDFAVISAHKLYGPSGVGVLYGREELLDSMPPFLSGGDMIRSVDIECTTFNSLPHKFEAGTPNIEGVIAFGRALEYLSAIGWGEIQSHECKLVEKLVRGLSVIDGVQVLNGMAHEGGLPSGLVSFICSDIHPHDMAQILDRYEIAVRAGHHCAQPLLKYLGVMATTRASFGIYNTEEDVDRLIYAITKVFEFFRK